MFNYSTYNSTLRSHTPPPRENYAVCGRTKSRILPFLQHPCSPSPSPGPAGSRGATRRQGTAGTEAELPEESLRLKSYQINTQRRGHAGGKGKTPPKKKNK